MADLVAGLEPVLTDPMTLSSAALPAQTLKGRVVDNRGQGGEATGGGRGGAAGG